MAEGGSEKGNLLASSHWFASLLTIMGEVKRCHLVAAIALMLVTAARANPNVDWNPRPIEYGTPIGAQQLNAEVTYNGAALDGTGNYTPADGTFPAVGEHTLRLTFIPNPGQGVAVDPIEAETILTVRRKPLLITVLLRTRVEYEPFLKFSGLKMGAEGLNGKCLTADQFTESVRNRELIYEGAPLANSDMSSVFGPFAGAQTSVIDIDGVAIKVIAPNFGLTADYDIKIIALPDLVQPPEQTVMIDATNNALTSAVLRPDGQPMQQGIAAIVGGNLELLRDGQNIRNLPQLVASGELCVYGIATIGSDTPGTYSFTDLMAPRPAGGVIHPTLLFVDGCAFCDATAAAAYDPPDEWRGEKGPGLTINVEAVNDPPPLLLGQSGSGKSIILRPIGTTYFYSVDEDQVLEIPVTDIVAGAPDPLITITNSNISQKPRLGTVSINDKGTPDSGDDILVYTPAQNAFGEDNFKIGDGGGEPSSYEPRICIRIYPVNDAPALYNPGSAKFGVEDLPGDLDLKDFIVDYDDDDITISIMSSFPNWLTPLGGGRIRVDPDPGFIGDYTVDYRATDNGDPPLFSDGSVVVEVLDFVPATIGGTVFVDSDNSNGDGPSLEGVEITLTGTDFLAGEAVRLEQLDLNSLHGGRVSMHPWGWSYLGPTGFSGIDFFGFTVRDPRGQTARGLTAISVFPRNTDRTPLIGKFGDDLFMAHRGGGELFETVDGTNYVQVPGVEAGPDGVGLYQFPPPGEFESLPGHRRVGHI